MRRAIRVCCVCVCVSVFGGMLSSVSAGSQRLCPLPAGPCRFSCVCVCVCVCECVCVCLCVCVCVCLTCTRFLCCSLPCIESPHPSLLSLLRAGLPSLPASLPAPSGAVESGPGGAASHHHNLRQLQLRNSQGARVAPCGRRLMTTVALGNLHALNQGDCPVAVDTSALSPEPRHSMGRHTCMRMTAHPTRDVACHVPRVTYPPSSPTSPHARAGGGGTAAAAARWRRHPRPHRPFLARHRLGGASCGHGRSGGAGGQRGGAGGGASAGAGAAGSVPYPRRTYCCLMS